jgi:hypothetical protein
MDTSQRNESFSNKYGKSNRKNRKQPRDEGVKSYSIGQQDKTSNVFSM